MTDPDAVNLALLVLRCVTGAVMLAHGVNHIAGGGKIQGTAGWFSSLGMEPGILHAWIASVVEVVAGIMLVFGFLTPLAAAAVVGIMLVAWIINHRGNGFFIFRPGEGWEYVMTLTAIGVVLGMTGPGEWSLDHAAELDDLAGWTGLAIVAAAGGGGAVGLLAVFWRPHPEANEG